MAKKPETLFKERVMRDLGSLPKTWFAKIQQVAIGGIPDLIVCANGQFVAIELKTDDGIISPLQRFNLEMIEKARGLSFVAMPSNWKEIFHVIKTCTE